MSFSSAHDSMDVPASLHRAVATEAESRSATPSRVEAPGILRAATRCVGMLGIFAAAAVDYTLSIPFVRKRDRLRERARWLHRWSRSCARAIGLRIEQHGAAPNSGMIVSNHLSYLDILVFGSITPCVFIAKQEVARWPLLGFFARLAGTVFVDRTRRMKVADANHCIAEALHAGSVVVLFAEGTSSDGRMVRPFRSSLLEPAVRAQSAVRPAAIRYHLDDGSVPDEVCYWRDMTLLPHLLNLLTKRHVRARLAFDAGETGTRSSTRKELTRQLHARVCDLHAEVRCGSAGHWRASL